MLKNYLTIAWRSLFKNSLYPLVNIAGLSAGIAFSLLIAVYVWGELQVNRQLRHADNQYIILSNWKDPNMGFEIGTVAELPKALKRQYPNLVANFFHWDGITTTISKGQRHFREGMLIGDSTMLNMYGFKLLYGDAGTALNEPFNVVITKKAALKYFDRADVVGQTINIENFKGTRHDFVISAVMDNPGRNSITNATPDADSQFFLPASAANFMGRMMDGWDNTNLGGFIELQPGVTPQQLAAPMRQLLKANASQSIAENLTPRLVPLKQYYLDANGGVVRKMVYTLLATALFILLMAVVNFINLCVSRSASRMKEIGVRKALGGLKTQLIGQFLTESVLLVMLSTMVAMGLYLVFRPYFMNVLLQEIPGLFSLHWYFYIAIAGVSALIGLLAGIYPAFVLSSFKSVDSLKGKLQVNEHRWLRKGLAGFQFGIAAVVIIAAFVISRQVKLFFSNSLGYDKEYVVYASVPRDWSAIGVQKMQAVRRQLAELPSVQHATLTWEVPNGQNGGPVPVFKQGTDSTKAIQVQRLMSDEHWAATFNIPVIAGQFFNQQNAVADSGNVVINETLLKALNFKNASAAIGQSLRIPGVPQPLTIKGVTANFHFGSMKDQMQPVVFGNVYGLHYYRYFAFKLRPGNMQVGLAQLQQKWDALLPGTPFEYRFMDAALQKLYAKEIQLQKAAYIATSLTFVIAFLGVLSLVSLSVQKRAKEIGIRKVLGASVSSVIGLFAKEFLPVVLVAVVVASPLAWLLMHNWLKDYAYRVDISIHPFVLCLVILAASTTLLIGMQTLKTALTSPAKSLKSE